MPTISDSVGRAVVRSVERRFDSAFGTDGNPLRHLGALGFLFFWMVVISGTYLYIVLDTSASGAYQSIETLSHAPWNVGGIMRSVHHYAADAFVIVMVAHLLREWIFGHFKGFRRFSWLTGIPLLLLAFASGLVGFWLNWDQLALFSVQSTAQWLDAVPLFSSPLARNFLSASTVSDRLFSLFIFMHIGLPLLLLFGLWFHIQRISRADTFPPRALAIGATGSLFLLAMVAPILSQAPVAMAREPQRVPLDWFFLFIHPLAQATSAIAVWGLLVGTFAVLFALPYFAKKRSVPVAVVNPANCNGCRRCFDDCPYAAVTMVPHPDRRMARQLAQVDSDLCASCGICVGSCPSSTPFRSVIELVTGIDLPQAPINQLRQQVQAELSRLKAASAIVVFGCDHGASVASLEGNNVAVFSLVCTGMLPPSFVEYAMRDGASGVLLSACRSGGCEFRLGSQWTQERLLGSREPALRPSVARDRLQLVAADMGEEDSLREALVVLQRRVATLDAAASTPDVI